MARKDATNGFQFMHVCFELNWHFLKGAPMIVSCITLFIRRNKASKDYGKRWNELQQYFKPDQHASTCLPGRSDERAVPSAKVCPNLFPFWLKANRTKLSKSSTKIMTKIEPTKCKFWKTCLLLKTTLKMTTYNKCNILESHSHQWKRNGIPILTAEELR